MSFKIIVSKCWRTTVIYSILFHAHVRYQTVVVFVAVIGFVITIVVTVTVTTDDTDDAAAVAR